MPKWAQALLFFAVLGCFGVYAYLHDSEASSNAVAESAGASAQNKAEFGGLDINQNKEASK